MVWEERGSTPCFKDALAMYQYWLMVSVAGCRDQSVCRVIVAYCYNVLIDSVVVGIK